MTQNRPAAQATQLVDDDRTRVTRYDFAPGAETGWHIHEYDYVVITITPCSMLLEEPDDKTRTAEFAAHEAYSRPQGVEHNVINNGNSPMTFIEIETKHP